MCKQRVRGRLKSDDNKYFRIDIAWQGLGHVIDRADILAIL